MGRQSKITKLPHALREELDRRLIEQGFAGYRGLENWLGDRGYEIKKSALQRYGASFEARLKALARANEEARAIVSAAPDDEAMLNDALQRLVQSRLYDLLIEIELDEPNLARVARAVADLGRSAVSQKRWSQEVRQRLEAQKKAADKALGKVSQDAGLTRETYETIRAILVGIDPLSQREHTESTLR